jgi:RNA polymerase sigma-70 factor (ECF subfamily)
VIIREGEPAVDSVSIVDEAMGRYAQGDQTAFEVVYEAVAPRLERYLRRHLREKSRIEDVIQQTFLQMHGARGSFIVGAEVMPWAFAIARRLMIDAARKGWREEPITCDVDQLAAKITRVASGQELIEAQEARQRLAAAYAGLSEPQRAAFELVKSEGMSHAEAASILGTTVTGIKLRVHRAYLSLRAAVADPEADAGANAAANADAQERPAARSPPRARRLRFGTHPNLAPVEEP